VSDILIIDDDSEFREMLKTMMEMEGFNVATAEDGKIGVDLYRLKPTDLIVTDIVMPNQEGVETIYFLQKEFPDVKIIAVSGGGRGKASDYLDSIKRLDSVKGTFQKPFNMDEFVNKVREVIGE